MAFIVRLSKLIQRLWLAEAPANFGSAHCPKRGNSKVVFNLFWSVSVKLSTMVSCAVATCNFYTENKKRFLSFYSFPSDEKLRAKWLDACKRKDIKNTRHLKSWHRICSMHFKSECFNYHLSVNSVKLCLKPRSSPSINLPGLGSIFKNATTYEDHIFSLGIKCTYVNLFPV